MKKIVIIFLFFASYSVTAQKWDSTLTIEIIGDKQGFFDPIQVKVTPIIYDKVFFERSEFQYRSIDSSQWQSLDSSYMRSCYGPVASPDRHNVRGWDIEWSSRERVELYSPTNGMFSQDYVFLIPGAYVCRLYVRPAPPLIKGLYSNVDTLYIKKYRRRDRKAIRKLIELCDSGKTFFPYLEGHPFCYENGFLLLKDEIFEIKSKSFYADLAKLTVINYIGDVRLSGYSTLKEDSFLELQKRRQAIYDKTRFDQIKVLAKASFMEKEDCIFLEKFYHSGRNGYYLENKQEEE